MKPLGVPIRLDRPRTLLIDEAAFHLIAEKTGVNLAEIIRDRIDTFTLTVDVTRALVWAGCRHEDGRLEFSKVSELITEANHEQFHEPISKAMARGLGVAYHP